MSIFNVVLKHKKTFFAWTSTNTKTRYHNSMDSKVICTEIF